MNTEKVKLIPWNVKSQGAKALSKALEINRLKTEGSTFKGGVDKTVINWGCSKVADEILKCKVVNSPIHVEVASNKISFFKRLQGKVSIPEFTTDTKVALEWVKQGKVVLARTKVNASGGFGIRFLEENLDEWVDAPLYTVYKKKKEEYRLHYAFGKLITIQQKVLRKTDDNGKEIDPKTVDFRVRNLSNGFVFKRNDVNIPADVEKQSRSAFEVSGLHFGAVDVIYNQTECRAYVLEINTAPGIEGTTVDEYKQAFMENL
jgi:glutathione synthase/RimK-type ligase-like ATP-grasp enzyme